MSQPASSEQKPFVVIAGPCVLEGERAETNLQAAQTLAKIVRGLQSQWDIRFYFKSSYDKANRTSIDGYRGPGLTKGLDLLKGIKETVGVPILTDVHAVEEIAPVVQVAEMIQIPAFLCRQTDLLVAAGESGVPVNIKKGQFLSPHDVVHCAEKVKSTGNTEVYMTERGNSFGYNNLVVDMRSVPIIQGHGLPVIFDATHSVQLPGGQGKSSGGKREFAPILARSAVAAGCDGLFFETHPNPDQGMSDGANMIPLDWVEEMLTTCLQIRDVVNKSAAKGSPVGV
ncbi:MAG: 3-deoxy-8-phosphooctulonate synthase [Vampirovibrio sp.]|nr:3-deoxy-8-phosphooctulonate synthase [Vampirovibrio sp.]